jgi:hypothetical protein
MPNGAVIVGSWHQPHWVVQMLAPGGGGRGGRGVGCGGADGVP